MYKTYTENHVLEILHGADIGTINLAKEESLQYMLVKHEMEIK